MTRMKQQITTKQLNELSEKGLRAYKAYLKDKYVNAIDYVLDKKAKPIDVNKYKVDQLPLLNIGQMIEFLDGRSTKKEYTALNVIIFEQGAGGTIFLPIEQWCDALWEAVKEVLEK